MLHEVLHTDEAVVGGIKNTVVHCKQGQATTALENNKMMEDGVVFQLGWVGKGQPGRVLNKNWTQSSVWTTKIRSQFSVQTTKKNWAQFRVRTPKIWAQSSTQTKQDLGTILWAIDENMGTDLQALYSSLAV